MIMIATTDSPGTAFHPLFAVTRVIKLSCSSRPLCPKPIYLRPWRDAAFWRPLPTVQRTNAECIFRINDPCWYCIEYFFRGDADGVYKSWTDVALSMQISKKIQIFTSSEPVNETSTGLNASLQPENEKKNSSTERKAVLISGMEIVAHSQKSGLHSS